MFDIIISGGTIIDGTGSPAYKSDIGITGQTIKAIGDLRQSVANRVIHSVGLVIAPGFIDTHTHSEGDLLVNPQHSYGLRQGITTELLGIDGMSYAPLSQKNYLIYRRWLKGLLGTPPRNLEMGSVKAFREHYDKKVAVNTAYLVPNGTVRLETVGFYDKPLVDETMNEAKRLVREGLEQGAVGFSTGSSYYPGPWTNTEELIELCEIVRESDGIYMCEPRRANPDRAFAGGGIEEALEITRRSGVKLHLAHYRTEPKNAGNTDKLMKQIDEAKAQGADITLDIYPYPSGSTIAVSYLPSDVQEGGPDNIIRSLSNPSKRKKIVDYLESEQYYSRSINELIFSNLTENRHLEGISLPEVAKKRGVSVGNALCDILLEEDLEVGHSAPPPVSYGLWRQIDQDCMKLLAREDYMVCSDITPAGGMPHPRTYGAFPRFLGRLRRNFGGISIEGMVHRMTERPARRFGLTQRGRIAKDYFADITIFDADRIIDTSTYEDPKQYPVGIPYVLVNGEIAVDREQCTGVLAGQAIP